MDWFCLHLKTYSSGIFANSWLPPPAPIIMVNQHKFLDTLLGVGHPKEWALWSVNGSLTLSCSCSHLRYLRVSINKVSAMPRYTHTQAVKPNWMVSISRNNSSGVQVSQFHHYWHLGNGKSLGDFEGCPVYYRMVSSISNFHLLDTSSTFSQL